MAASEQDEPRLGGQRPAGEASASQEDGDFVVPRLPRGKGMTLSTAQMMRIGMTLVTLIALVALQRPCSQAVGRFVTTFGEQPERAGRAGRAGQPDRAGEAGGGGPALPGTAREAPAPADTPQGAPPSPAPIYERLSTSMTEAELRAAIERAERRAKAAAAARAPAAPSAAPASPSAVPANPSTVPVNPSATSSSPARAPASPPAGPPPAPAPPPSPQER